MWVRKLIDIFKKITIPYPEYQRNWASRLDLSEDILTQILTLMKLKANSLSDVQKLIVLFWWNISHKIEIDRKVEQAMGPHKTSQIAHSLFCKWKQIVYYDYDQSLNSSIVNEVIKKLYDAHYTVVAVTMDPCNSKTWKEMNVGLDEGQKTFFTHPSNDLRVCFCWWNLLKLIRNHYLDRGFLIRTYQQDMHGKNAVNK